MYSILGCLCNGRKDPFLGRGGKCTNGPEGQWCYVNEDSGCEDLREYHGNHVSVLPCMTTNTTTTASTVEGRNIKPGECSKFPDIIAPSKKILSVSVH